MLNLPSFYQFSHTIRSGRLSGKSIRDCDHLLKVIQPLPFLDLNPPISPTIVGFYFEWRAVMAAQRKDYSVEFVNITISTSDKPKFEAWVQNEQADIFELLTHILASSYKVSTSLDQSNDCYIASFTGKEDCRYNAKKCLTSRAGTLEEALWLNLYKHFAICDQGDWGAGSNSQSAWG